MQGRNRLCGAALRHHVPGATFALTALRCNAQFELDFLKAHTCTGVAGNVAVRDAMANTDDHDAGRVGWLLKMGQYRCEWVAFAMADPKVRLSSFATPGSADLAHLRLKVVLQAHLANEVELRFQEVDVFFGVVKNAL